MPHLKTRLQSIVESRQKPQPNKALSCASEAKYHQLDALRFCPVIIMLMAFISLINVDQM